MYTGQHAMYNILHLGNKSKIPMMIINSSTHSTMNVVELIPRTPNLFSSNEKENIMYLYKK